MKKKLVWIISNVQKSYVFEWQLEELKEHFNLQVLLLNPDNSPFENFLKEKKIQHKRIYIGNKLSYIGAFLKVLYHLIRFKPDIVHCHLIEAQIIGLLSSYLIRTPKRVYTRHNSNYHHVYFPKAIKYDLLSNHLSTHIISISQATYDTLTQLEHVSPSKIITIYHPFKIKDIQYSADINKESVCNKWNIPTSKFIVLCISRYIEWKGIQYLIPAFKKFLKQYPDSFLIIANAHGPYKNTISSLLSELPNDSYKEIFFEENIYSLYKISNIFIHVPTDPISEAFGQVYIESFALSVPSIITLSGIAREIAKHKHNAYIVPSKDTDSIYGAMVELKNNSSLINTLKKNAPLSVQSFDFNEVIHQIIKFYNE